MGFLNSGISAIIKLAAAIALCAAFLLGLAGVVYMSLQGSEVRVPEIVGKNFGDSEKELLALGLKIKRRAERPSTETPNTVLEQLPKAGETVKTGQLILVVTSSHSLGGEETPSTLLKSLEEDDSEKIEEMISDKPKKSKSNSNTAKKRAETTRDVLGNTVTTGTDTDATPEGNSNKKEPATGTDKDKESPGSPGRPTGTPAAAKPTPGKSSAGDKPRTPPRP
jgi:beta-lactam-binding protein with PASTA domain